MICWWVLFITFVGKAGLIMRLMGLGAVVVVLQGGGCCWFCDSTNLEACKLEYCINKKYINSAQNCFIYFYFLFFYFLEGGGDKLK